jgi:NADP-dependent 3-hydroxy acid dehydrogenase YdfG
MMIETNLDAAFNLTRAVVPPMRAAGAGLIVHIASIAARRPDLSGLAYQASKAGVLALAHATMEEERANGIRVSAILPGLTDTPLVLRRPTPPTPEMLAKALQPEDVAAACLFVMRLPPRAHLVELQLVPTRS